MNDTIEHLKMYLPSSVSDSLDHFSLEQRKQISEIRLRLNRACSATIANKNNILIDYKSGKYLKTNELDMSNCFKKICEKSIYKYEKEIRNGYITLSNGCRVGFCGTRTENGFIRDISSINFRVSKFVENAGSEIYPLLFKGNMICSSLIVSQPCAGKTTILSDLAYKLSEDCFRVSIVDERGEIAAVHRGDPQKKVGLMCDILDNYPKGEGMMIALRSLSPQVLICDEIGSGEDVSAMMQAMNAGVPVIASAHADDPIHLLSRPQLKYLIENGAIERFFFLEGPHRPGKLKQVLSIEEIYETIGNSIDAHKRISVC